jgi:hypothetical protein
MGLMAGPYLALPLDDIPAQSGFGGTVALPVQLAQVS